MTKRQLLALAACACMLTGCGINPFESRTENPPQTSAAETTAAPEPETTAAETVAATAETTAEGGNPAESGEIRITVSEEAYLYDNAEISFDDLVDLLDGLADGTAVAVQDDNAAQRAYQQLMDALTERNIAYTETE